MSDYIVLVKQVPDITQITDNAFNLETGTLIRSRLESVINELDTHALAVANRMNQLSEKRGKIIALTMGPPMAEEILRYCLGRCADSAILLTDHALGGADTCATANPLAFAIRKIAKELLNNSQDYYIVSGMQSVDGDTAQVPAQIAEELGVPCVAYATNVKYNEGRFEFTRIISGGNQIAAVRSTPAVITVAKYEYPLFATFAGYRQANKFELIQWGANHLNATNVGIDGSRTRVISVFPPGKTTRKCQHITDADELAKVIIENFGKQQEDEESSDGKYILPDKRDSLLDRSFEGTKKESEDYKIFTGILEKHGIKKPSDITGEEKEKILAAAGEHFHKNALEDMLEGLKTTEPMYHGQVWVVAEQDEQKIRPSTFELIGKARSLADCLGTQVGAVVAGGDVQGFCKELIEAGADEIYTIEHPLLENFDPKICAKAIAETIAGHWPQIVLYAATPQGRILAPMIAYKLGCGLTADCTGLEIKDSSRKGQIAILMQTRPALGGNVMATICTKDSKCQMATARPGVMKRLEPDSKRKGKIIKEHPQISEADLSLDIIRTEKATGKINLGVEIVVSGGKGMQSRDNYDKLVDQLASVLSQRLGRVAEKGASRAAVEQGFADRIRQVGQTGTSIGPKLYVALGISGAIQHMIGVANSDIIVAVNSDVAAPIFKHCDYYITGTVEDIVPKLAEALVKNI
ncbi:MAG: FAD-binding protein [Planctomycetes bacterium]|nr:FAD-binding protein [Planctomycetota bacterium]MBU1517376.1 FAD-binding protein [Planctomycetota bacterium]MBU2458158.1 FAD-binding protein [Planctomycetota bacterium]MBU2596480.1 FAD-binding protein [Planctomycetota bacterium]